MARTSEAQAQDLAGDTAGAVHDAEQAIEGGVGKASLLFAAIFQIAIPCRQLFVGQFLFLTLVLLRLIVFFVHFLWHTIFINSRGYITVVVFNCVVK